MRRSVGLIGVHRRRLHAALHRRALACGVGIVTGIPVVAVDPGEPEGAPAVVCHAGLDPTRARTTGPGNAGPLRDDCLAPTPAAARPPSIGGSLATGEETSDPIAKGPGGPKDLTRRRP